MAGVWSLFGQLPPPQGNAMAVSEFGEGAACPAYPWPTDGGRGGGQGKKAFMQSDCAACHQALPYAVARATTDDDVQARAAEIVVVHEAVDQAPPMTLHGAAAYPPDLTRALEGLRRTNAYSVQELRMKMALPTPAWLQFLRQPWTAAT